MDEGSPARPYVIAAFLGLLVVAAVWSLLYWRDAARSRATSLDPTAEVVEERTDRDEAAPDGAAGQPQDDPEQAQASPAEDPAGPEPENAENVDELPPADDDAAVGEDEEDSPEDETKTPAGPATGDYAAFSTAAEMTHPDTDPDIRRWYDWFGYYVGGDDHDPQGEWTNKAELWDAITSVLRPELASLGEPHEDTLWDADVALPASVNVRWSTEDTGGRGELVEFMATYTDAHGEGVRRHWPLLIRTLPDGSGEIFARMEPFDHPESRFTSYLDHRKDSGHRQWEWVLDQEVPER